MLTSRFFLAAMLVAASACSSAPNDEHVGSAGDAVTVAVASYEVPVAPELASAATFPVGWVSWQADGANATLDYQLPLALTGVPQRVLLHGTFDGAKNAFVLAGAIGTAECSVHGVSLRCAESLSGVTVDENAAVLLTPTTVDAVKRRAVIDRFPSEPIGILSATLPVSADSRYRSAP